MKSNEIHRNELGELIPADTEEFLPSLLPSAWQGALLPRKVFFHPFSPVLPGSVGCGARQSLGCKELGEMGSVRLVLLRVWRNRRPRSHLILAFKMVLVGPPAPQRAQCRRWLTREVSVCSTPPICAGGWAALPPF